VLVLALVLLHTSALVLKHTQFASASHIEVPSVRLQMGALHM